VSESLHFMKVSLLFGVVGLRPATDGFLKQIPMSELHRLIPWGIAAYCINILSGFTFTAGAPDQYSHNPAFHMKILFIMGPGINVSVFYLMSYELVREMGAGEVAPVRARIAGAVSLACGTGVIVCRRYITFFRPPARWCIWC
jgi:hypothetical protein